LLCADAFAATAVSGLLAFLLCHLRKAVMKKAEVNKKTPTVTTDSPQNRDKKQVKSLRKNTTSTTREEGRQRSGNNGPQQGSH
jgi:hypothetical protein